MKIIILKNNKNEITGYQTLPLKPVEDVIEITDEEFKKLNDYLNKPIKEK